MCLLRVSSTQLLPDRLVGLDFGRFDFGKPVGMLAGTAAHGPRVAVQHLEYRQGALLLGQFLGHGEGGGQGHEGVVAIIVVAAEGMGVGQGTRGYQLAQRHSLLQLLDQGRHQLGHGRLLEQGDQPLHARRRFRRCFVGQGPAGQAHVGRQTGPDQPHQHALSHFHQKISTIALVHVIPPLKSWR